MASPLDPMTLQIGYPLWGRSRCFLRGCHWGTVQDSLPLRVLMFEFRRDPTELKNEMAFIAIELVK